MNDQSNFDEKSIVMKVKSYTMSFSEYQDKEINRIFEDALNQLQKLDISDPDYQKYCVQLKKEKENRLSKVLNTVQFSEYKKAFTL